MGIVPPLFHTLEASHQSDAGIRQILLEKHYEELENPQKVCMRDGCTIEQGGRRYPFQKIFKNSKPNMVTICNGCAKPDLQFALGKSTATKRNSEV